MDVDGVTKGKCGGISDDLTGTAVEISMGEPVSSSSVFCGCGLGGGGGTLEASLRRTSSISIAFLTKLSTTEKLGRERLEESSG